MNIIIDYTSRVPIYEQIVLAIERQVALGILKPKEGILSIRELALNLSINPNTVKKAYDILENKKIIVSRSTKGTYIADDISLAKKEKINSLLEEMHQKMTELENLGLTKDEILKKL